MAMMRISGPGEARDVLFTAPAYASPGFTDAWGTYNRYLFRNRDPRKLSNNGAAGLGGMATEVRVYAPGSAVPAPVIDAAGRIPPNLTYVR